MNDAGDIHLGSYSGWYPCATNVFFAEDETEMRADGGRYACETGNAGHLDRGTDVFFRLSASTTDCWRTTRRT